MGTSPDMARAKVAPFCQIRGNTLNLLGCPESGILRCPEMSQKCPKMTKKQWFWHFLHTFQDPKSQSQSDPIFAKQRCTKMALFTTLFFTSSGVEILEPKWPHFVKRAKNLKTAKNVQVATCWFLPILGWFWDMSMSGNPRAKVAPFCQKGQLPDLPQNHHFSDCPNLGIFGQNPGNPGCPGCPEIPGKQQLSHYYYVDGNTVRIITTY